MNIVSTNKVLVELSFTELTEEERLKKWKLARTSNEVLEVKAMHK